MRHKQMNISSSPAPKWLNMCWDSFRHVDNHNKSHIFQPRLPRPALHLAATENGPHSPGQGNQANKRRSARVTSRSPYAGGIEDEEKTISIEIVREKLKANQFRNIDEFNDEMQTMFSTWLEANGKHHKYFKTFQSIVERFTKQINRAKQRVKDA